MHTLQTFCNFKAPGMHQPKTSWPGLKMLEIRLSISNTLAQLASTCLIIIISTHELQRT